MCLRFATVSSSKIMLEIRLVVTFITTKVVNWIISTVINLALETKQVFERWKTGNEIFAMFLFIQWKNGVLSNTLYPWLWAFTFGKKSILCDGIYSNLTILLLYRKLLHLSFTFQYFSILTGRPFFTGSGRGVLIQHYRLFFTRILHPACFSSVSQIPLFFPKKKHIKKSNFYKS